MTLGAAGPLGFKDVCDSLTLLSLALTGQALNLKETGRAIGHPTGRNGRVDCLELPDTCVLFASHKENYGAMRLEVLRHAMGFETGGRWHFEHARASTFTLIGPVRSPDHSQSELNKAFASWPRPILLHRVFDLIEGARVDLALPNRFPGAGNDLRQTRLATLQRRPLPRTHRPIPSGLEVLRQFALGADRAYLKQLVTSPEIEKVLDIAEKALRHQATVYDSFRSALEICAVLENATMGRFQAIMRIAPGSSNAPVVPIAGGGPETVLGESTNGTEEKQFLHATSGSGAFSSSDFEQAMDHDPFDPAALTEPDTPPQALTKEFSELKTNLFFHREWDFRASQYRRNWVCIHEEKLTGKNLDFLQELRARHPSISRQIRRQFSATQPAWRDLVHKTLDGDLLDHDSVMEARVARRAGHLGDERVYAEQRRVRRDICTALLLDMSGSTGFLIPDPKDLALSMKEDDDDIFLYGVRPPEQFELLPRRRVIDVAKDAIGLICDGLHQLGDRHAIYSFSGDGRHQVDFHISKAFDENWSSLPAAALASIEPRNATRTGAAIRHAVSKIVREPERRKILIIVSDGYPQDRDYGPSDNDTAYALHDTAKALKEAERQGVLAFCVTLDQAANDYLRQMCPSNRYLIVDEISTLPKRLNLLYRTLTSH